MKHKLLPTMIGAVLAGGMGVAQADITIFGHLDTSIVSFDNEVTFNDNGSVTKSDEDDINFKCTTCSIGFKGSEDLGNGLSAIFKLDFQFDMFDRNKGDEGDSLTDRDQWLGLKGGFGQVRWGSISTGYKSHGAKLDPVYRTSVQGRSIGLQSGLHLGAGEEGQGRAEQTVRWDSPNWNGVKVIAHYTLDTVETPEDEDPFGIGAQYSNGGIFVFTDYLTNDGDSKTANELTAWKIGGKYTINNFAFMGQYEDIEDDSLAGASIGGLGAFTGGIPFAGVDLEQTTWHIAGTYTMGNNTIYLAYGENEFEFSDATGPDKFTLDSETISLVGVHSISKRTLIYAGVASIEADGNDLGVKIDGESDNVTIGMKHKF